MKKILKGIGITFVALFTIIFIVALVDVSNDTTNEISSIETEVVQTEKEENIDNPVSEEPQLTLGQKNAIKKAKSYLNIMGFSKEGLRKQLQFEQFENEDIEYALENCGADWNKEAAEKAQSYLDIMSYSKDGLYDQLEFEGFTPEQIEYVLTAVGY